jgi:hypothetical protein
VDGGFTLKAHGVSRRTVLHAEGAGHFTPKAHGTHAEGLKFNSRGQRPRKKRQDVSDPERVEVADVLRAVLMESAPLIV